MSNQQNFAGQPTSDNFNFTAIHSALVAQEEHSFDLNDSAGGGPSLPNLAYCYGPQESVYTSGGGLQVDSDAGHSYSAPCPMGSGSTNHEEHWAVEMLHTMENLFRENLLVIEELLRRRDGLQRCRGASFRGPDSTTTVPLPVSLHNITSSDADPNGPSELWPHHDIWPGSLSSTRAGPFHNDFPVTATARASSVPVDICMDPENTAMQSPSYTVLDSPNSRHFLCECGHQTKTKGDMLRHHETLKHTQRKYACPCGVSYTRGDGLKRHQRSCGKRKRLV